jgi:tyrosine-protein kinase
VSLLVTSSVPREGTTAIACGLAIAMAETGSQVVLVDANLREPGVASYLALDATTGLADVLAGFTGVDEVLRDWGGGRMKVLPAGYPAVDPGELLAAPALAQTIGVLEDRFDVVLIDAPPLLSTADAAVLSKLTSSTMLVVRAGRTRTEQVERAVAILHGVGARIVGGVLNALPKKLPGASPWRRPEPVPQWRLPEQQTALLAAPVTEHAGSQALTGDPGGVGIVDLELPDDAGTARGRARVLPPPGPVRGRARVVIDAEPPDPPEAAQPAQPVVPAPRDPVSAGQDTPPGTPDPPAPEEGAQQQPTADDGSAEADPDGKAAGS